MFVIECLPFSKGLNKDYLSYFSSKPIEVGSLVKVNIRNKSTNALVIAIKDVTEAKTELKSAHFQLKKIISINSKPFLQKEFLEAIKTTAEYFVTNEGNIIPHLIPSFILENPGMLQLSKTVFDNPNNSKIKNEIAILQVPDEERFIHYRSLIREEFAKKKSVFLCLPKNQNIKQAKEKLERGIESFVYTFHNELNKKDLKKEWQGALKTTHPVLVIATTQWLFLPRKDFGTIIIDRENENGWKTISKPFIDLRFFIETLANKKNIRTIIGDSFLRIETLNRYKEGELVEFESVKWRLPKDVMIKVVDLKESAKKEKEFKTISPTLLNLINDTVSNGSNMFIFGARKGLSSITICRDCGEQVKCFNCNSPMVLYRTQIKVRESYDATDRFQNSGIFKCHQCGETRKATEVCQNCRSWKLAAFGSGIDRIAEEIKKSIPNINLFEIHKDATSTNLKALKTVQNFYESRGSVLLGTEMAFPYLYKKVGSSAIASFDSLFSIPDFRIREKIFRLILQTRNLAKEKFLIQSHNPDDLTIEFAINGNLAEFYKKEIEDRKILNYPPFGIFIKITIRGTRNFVSKETERLAEIFNIGVQNKTSEEKYNIIVFPSTHEKKGEQTSVNAVIKLKKEYWPKPILSNLLKSLPPHFEIKVDPDNLL
ncbi:MAG: primosomal protein N' [Candidatus Zambryskibacteria bacterium CG10_big_fil_rev_8_21_14_0_10_34_34]|uniref:Primosomal protein N n=1 Tax=Candidatus Zambryskibacteria bacterium CG10_big_fil_rev_8_21_14_0_10_34_34 TaxID=1975114 RepID=A0A2H0R1C7_9BACT|nr:MAG: primosomal protein N' [Candidatus Zambryskibacteria bacterium CG10_big_fil_rev_8_21_14_0_10_34_34]